MNNTKVDYIISLVAQGKKRHQIVKDEEVASWKFSKIKLNSIIKRARVAIEHLALMNADQHIAKAILELNYIYQLGLTTGDLKSALAARKELNDLLSLKRLITTTAPPAKGIDSKEEALRIINEVPMEEHKAIYSKGE